MSESGAPNLVSRTFDCQHMAIFPFLTGQAARSAGCRPVGQASQVYNYPIPSMLKRRNGQNVNMSSIITSRKKKNAPCDFPGKITSTSAPNPPQKMNHLFFSKTQYIFTTRLPHPPVLLLAKSDLEHCVDPPER